MTLPPLPEKVQIDKHESGYVIRGYTTDQMKAYAQAAQQARQPLSDEQIMDCFQQRHQDKATQRRMIARAIERAHGIGGEE